MDHWLPVISVEVDLIDAGGDALRRRERIDQDGLAERLVHLVQFHQIHAALLESHRNERATWLKLASIEGTASTAGEVLDSYANTSLVPPWADVEIPVSALLSPKVVGSRPRMDIIAERIRTVLVNHELRTRGAHSLGSWPFVRAVLAIASEHGSPLDVVAPTDERLEHRYVEGVAMLRTLGAPTPPTHQEQARP